MKQQKIADAYCRSTSRLQLKAVCLFAAILLLFSHCKKEMMPEATGEESAETANAKKQKSREIVVHPGTSIQAAVDAVCCGMVIKIEAGVYKQKVVVAKSHVTIIGNGEVIIQNPGDEEDGIKVTGDHFTLQNVTIKDFKENGIILDHVQGFLLSKVTAVDNGDYGIFPIFCNNGEIEKCTASGHSDTGIYVGQSTNINMHHCVAYANVNGLEVENCKRVSVDHNLAYDNAVGILSVLLPKLQVKEATHISITDNRVINNNHKNFAEEDELEANVPSGSGILIVGTDNTHVQNNYIADNKFTGIAVVSTLVLGQLSGETPDDFADIEPNPDRVKVIENTLTHNGYEPPSVPFPAVDLLWDGSGDGNCWSKNLYSTSYPASLPSCH